MSYLISCCKSLTFLFSEYNICPYCSHAYLCTLREVTFLIYIDGHDSLIPQISCSEFRVIVSIIIIRIRTIEFQHIQIFG